MRSRLLLMSLFAGSSLPIAAPAQDWQQGPVGNPHDLTPSAVSKGQFATGNRLLSDNAVIFVACKGTQSSKPVLELRFSVASFAGFNPDTVPKAAVIHIDGDSHPASVDSFPLQGSAFFVVVPDAAGAKQIADVGHNRSATLSFDFQSSGRKFSFITTLGEPAGPVGRVLTACGVAVPAPPPAPLTPAEAAKKPPKYVMEGVHLGMTEQEVRQALKAAGSLKGLESTDLGYFKATTTDAIFDAIQMNDVGRVWSYSFSAKNPRHLKSTKDSGPTYHLGVKAFGSPVSKTNSGVVWAPENDRHIESAYYDWDAQEGPGGRVLVTNGLQTTKPQ